MERIEKQPYDIAMLQKMEKVLGLIKSVSVQLNLWKSQNTYFSIHNRLKPEISERIAKGDHSARTWADIFRGLGEQLDIKVEFYENTPGHL